MVGSGRAPLWITHPPLSLIPTTNHRRLPDAQQRQRQRQQVEWRGMLEGKGLIEAYQGLPEAGVTDLSPVRFCVSFVGGRGLVVGGWMVPSFGWMAVVGRMDGHHASAGPPPHPHIHPPSTRTDKRTTHRRTTRRSWARPARRSRSRRWRRRRRCWRRWPSCARCETGLLWGYGWSVGWSVGVVDGWMDCCGTIDRAALSSDGSKWKIYPRIHPT